MNCYILTANSVNPHFNLAVEQLLFERESNDIFFYLWQNQNTVVIGKNQNAWRECRTDTMKKDGITLARRTTGGGAVFHDLGNLNFTFIVPKPIYDVKRQFSVITSAISKFGIETIPSGRNDVVLTTGEKISGNAFQIGKNVCVHHGTLLINTDMNKLAKYLSPSKNKLQAKGVKSVRSRVMNLGAINSNLSPENISDALKKAFISEYGPTASISDDVINCPRLLELKASFSSWDWLYGHSAPMELTLETRFDWGNIEINISSKQGLISDIKIYTDALDTAIPDILSKKLIGCRLSPEDMSSNIIGIASPQYTDIALWIKNTEI